MHEQSSGGFRCFVSCRQRRKGKKVEKQENAPLFNICNYWSRSLLTWSLFNPAETLQLNMQRCLHGSFSAASNTRLSSDLSAICCLDSSGRDNLRILGVPAGANHVSGCLQKFVFKMASSKEAWDGEIGWTQRPEQSRGYVQTQWCIKGVSGPTCKAYKLCICLNILLRKWTWGKLW